MSIYTRFGSPCTIELAGPANKNGRIPVRILIDREDAVAAVSKETWADELRADGGIAEISSAINDAWAHA